MEIIGQKHLLDKLNTFTIDTFPRSCIFLGDKGSGKHLICNYVKDNIIKLPLIDLTENISSEVIDNIYRNPNPNIYIIDSSKITEREQNIILKFLEEPLNNTFIILLCETKTMLLDTIINRCICFEMEQYTPDELKRFLTTEPDQDLLVQILHTPGEIKDNNLQMISEMRDLCDKIINKMNLASYANTLTIANKINYKDEFNKYPMNIFLNLLQYYLKNDYIQNERKLSSKMYLTIMEERKKLRDSRLNKEYWFTNLLTNLWHLARE